MSVTELILQARAKKASEMIFIVGSEPKVKTMGLWSSAKSAPVVLGDWTVLVQTLLNSQQKALLETLGHARGETQIGPQRVGFSFLQTDSILRVHLNLESDLVKTSDSQVIPAIFETCSQLKGLTVMCGANHSQLLTSLFSLLDKMNQELGFVALVLSASSIPQLKEHSASFMYQPYQGLKDFKNEELFKGVDLVVIHGVLDDQVIAEAVKLVENGIAVIYTSQSSSALSFLRRAYSVCSEVFGNQGSARLAEALQVLSAQVAGKGLNEDWIVATEYVLVRSHIRGYIASEDLKSMISLLNGQAEMTGVQTLNQSLIQSLVRRKLDLKTAFSLSPDPEGLDAQLKKIGV